MNPANRSPLPTWVRRSHGALEPFDPDRINRTIFAATEAVGNPDPFVARELADGVLHFLAQEDCGSVVTSAWIGEMLVKVIRELGQPELARVIAQHHAKEKQAEREPSEARADDHTADLIENWLRGGEDLPTIRNRLGNALLSRFTLERVYSRNLAASHRGGLLTIGGLDRPGELEAAVIHPFSRAEPPGLHPWVGIYETISQTSRYVGRTLILDGPEKELARGGVRVHDAAAWIRELDLAARGLGLEVVVNIGSDCGAGDEDAGTPGPLFRSRGRDDFAERSRAMRDAIVDHVLSRPRASGLRLDYHLKDELPSGEDGLVLDRLILAAGRGLPVCFVWDRPRRPVSLAEGISRNRPALLGWIGLHLPPLLERLRQHHNTEEFLAKLRSLVRLAVSAGVQKREFIRQLPRGDRPPFLLDQAHAGLYLCGVDVVVTALLGPGTQDRAAARALARTLYRTVLQTAADESRTSHLDCIVGDAPSALGLDLAPEGWQSQLRQIGKLHAMCRGGTLNLIVPQEMAQRGGWLANLIGFVGKHTSINRLRLLRRDEHLRQQTMPGLTP